MIDSDFERVKSHILSKLGHTPTDDQSRATSQLVRFLYAPEGNAAFLLRGYAGTGKTTLVSALIKVAPDLQIKTVLLAPTGRAAKVISGYSGKRAYTIHKKIYTTIVDPSGNMRVARGVNKHSYTLFIVDESSMIGLTNVSGNAYAPQNILDDLCDYVGSGNHCRLLFVGDSAQLPPVGESESPALEQQYLTSAMGLSVYSAELTQVVRQKNESGILVTATDLRNRLLDVDDFSELNLPLFERDFSLFSDVEILKGEDLVEVFNREYSELSLESVVLICRTNKRANLFNQSIRNRILFRDSEICTGDYLMIVKNNYHWLEVDSSIGFIANGDIVEVMGIRNHEELYGFHFVDATVRFVDYPDAPTLDCKILLETLHSESANLTSEESQRLYSAVAEDYSDMPSKAERSKAIRSNPYYNALQVKFAYALTCHKTQGGQWKTVIIEQGYLTDEMLNKEYIRWLYTALTRATEKVYLLNFEDRFFATR